MTALPATVATLFLAYCFAAAGDLLLGRRSTSLSLWNQSLLVGLSVITTLFFPLSIVLPKHALMLTLVFLIAIGIIGCVHVKPVAPQIFRGAARERVLVYAVLASLTAYTSIFYFTNWELALHIQKAYSRLLVHIAPVAAIGMAAAYARLSGYTNP